MAEQDTSHWWYQSRRTFVRRVLTDACRSAPPGPIVDIGCGTGSNLETLAATSARQVVGFDLELSALRHACRRTEGRANVVAGLAERLALPERSAGIVVAMDVLEHLDDDVVALREMHRVLAPQGIVLVTVPAYQWLWSTHDDWAAHRRRYRSGQLTRVLTAAGFEIVRCTYFHSFLLPPAVLLRRTPLGKMVNGTQEEIGATSRVVNSAASTLAALERSWTVRMRLPAGLSLLAVGRRP